LRKYRVGVSTFLLALSGVLRGSSQLEALDISEQQENHEDGEFASQLLRLAGNLGENRCLKILELQQNTLSDEEISGVLVRSLVLAFPRLEHMDLFGNHITRQGLQAYASQMHGSSLRSIGSIEDYSTETADDSLPIILEMLENNPRLCEIDSMVYSSLAQR
jgi:Ran GTPase-activating protein (RanGAP) involved in mRNA processing and transport